MSHCFDLAPQTVCLTSILVFHQKGTEYDAATLKVFCAQGI